MNAINVTVKRKENIKKKIIVNEQNVVEHNVFINIETTHHKKAIILWWENRICLKKQDEENGDKV
ncbi:hypothetical protein [Anaerosporobacter faecicola]|uniref:hypothetical protein n=1 Tax=Anaerosporobacter faecicola TaxID=2718714 RepID=UPI00143A073B|nr:hypothetical protein [Anaerosporobacter faecicola]